MGLFLTDGGAQLDHGGASRRLGQGLQHLLAMGPFDRYLGLRSEDQVTPDEASRGQALLVVQERQPSQHELQVTGQRPPQAGEVRPFPVAVHHEQVTGGAKLHGSGGGRDAEPR